MAEKATTVLIVGSGASAGPIAFELARAGIDVMILEKGDWCENHPLNEDELAQTRLEMYRPSGELDPTLVYSKGELVSESSRIGQSFYLVGGGTVRYAGTSWRFRTQDFRKLSLYGAVPGSSLVDWPLSYEELEPYYTKAELEIGISGNVGEDPTEPQRSKNVLLPPLKGDSYQERLMKAARGLGWHPFRIPLALHSQSSKRTGANACMLCGWCSGYPCMYNAKSAVSLSLYPRALKTGKLQIKTRAYATRILVDARDRVTGVEYMDLDTNQSHVMQCRILVLAASAVQTARLLLQSTSGRFPNGLANSSGMVGRNLMFHIEAKGSAVFDDDFHQGYYKKVGIHDFYFPQSGDPFVNHRSIQSGSKPSPIAFASSLSGYGEGFMQALRKGFLHTQELQCMVEDLPQLGNRVTLSATRRDAWGMPAPEVHHAYHEMDRHALESAILRMRQLLEAAGGREISVPKTASTNITGRYTWHLMGTARMGHDPAESVLNSDGMAHDVANLWVVDGSAFPTSAGLNPTLTMQAFSFRAADRLKLAMKEGRV